MGNSGSQAIVVRITTNFPISREQREKIASQICHNMNEYDPFIEFHELGEADIIYKGTTDKALKITFNYNSGSTPNDFGVNFVRKFLLDILSKDLSVKLDRVVVMCSQIDPDRVDTFTTTEPKHKK